MGAQKVAGEEDTLLRDIGENGVRPVNPGSDYELEACSAQRYDIAVLCLLSCPPFYQAKLSQQIQRSGRSQYFGFRILLQEPLQSSGVVLLRMLDDDVVQPLDRLGSEAVHEHFYLALIHSIDESSLLFSPDQIGVVAGSPRKGNQSIKESAIPVQCADPHYSRPDLSAQSHVFHPLRDQSRALKSLFIAPHMGQIQLSGRSEKGVPGAIPESGSPFAGS